MKLTSVERIGRSQLISSVRWTSSGKHATTLHSDNGRSPAAERGRTLAANAHESCRSLCEKAAVHRQEPAAHDLFRQLGHEGTRHAHEAETASLFSEATARCRNRAAEGRRTTRGRGPLSYAGGGVGVTILPDHGAEPTVAGQVHGVGGATRPPNKEMKLTSVERIGRSQLISGVRRTNGGLGQA
jgi:hypothetical protein